MGTNVSMLETMRYISRSNPDTAGHGGRRRAGGEEAAVHTASAVRKQRKLEERLFPVHGLLLHSPASWPNRDDLVPPAINRSEHNYPKTNKQTKNNTGPKLCQD